MTYTSIVRLEKLSADDLLRVVTPHGIFDFYVELLSKYGSGYIGEDLFLTYLGPERQFAGWKKNLRTGANISLGDSTFFLQRPWLSRILNRQRKVVVGKGLKTELGSLGKVLSVTVIRKGIAIRD